METVLKTCWKIDHAHSEIAFKVKHMMISTVTGHFENFDAEIESTDDNFSDAKAKFSAEVASIKTRNDERDIHLKSEDFFNAEKFPELKFASKSFDGHTLLGDLTIRNITKEVTLHVNFNGVATDHHGQIKAGFKADGKINRKDFKLTWNAVTEAGSVVVGDIVKLDLQLQFVKS